MRSFRQFILEYKGFAPAKDVDFIIDDSMIILNKNDVVDYKIEGKTHDMNSHALKHLGEFQPQVVMKIEKKIRDYIKSKPELLATVQIYNINGNFSKEVGEKALNKATPYEVLNYLDVINDRKINGRKLTEYQKDMLPFLKELGKAYDLEVNRRIGMAMSLDGEPIQVIQQALKMQKVVKFEGYSGMAVDFYLDLVDNAIIIASPDYIRTLFRFDKPASTRQGVVRNFLARKKLDVDSSLVKEMLRQFAK